MSTTTKIGIGIGIMLIVIFALLMGGEGSLKGSLGDIVQAPLSDAEKMENLKLDLLHQIDVQEQLIRNMELAIEAQKKLDALAVPPPPPAPAETETAP